MNKQLSYIKKEDRKKVLLLCDDIRMHSGIATMAREFVVGTAHHFNWLNLGAAINHPEIGKKIRPICRHKQSKKKLKIARYWLFLITDMEMLKQYVN